MTDEQISHEEFQERYGDSTIPYNFDELGPAGIACPKCEERTEEEQWAWVDTLAYDYDDSFDFEVHGVVLACPECGNETTFR